MTALPGLSFGTPWVLALLVVLPLLWRLLRVTPPGARRVAFPAVTLLFGLEGRREQAEATPPWLMALRLTLAALLIIAAARPNLDGPPASPAGAPLLLVVDDGWAAARDWAKRRQQLEQVLDGAERAGQPVLSLTTAPAADGGPITLGRLAPAAEARQTLAGLEPKPWATDRRAALAALKSLPFDKAGRVVWLSDGLGGEADEELARTLQGLGGGLDLIVGRTGRVILPPDEDSAADSLSPRLRRLPSPDGESVAVRGLDATGTVLARAEARFEPGSAETTAPLLLPPELRNRLVRLEIEGERSAAATLLLDERWRRHSVGLAGGEPGTAPLLERLYYLERALAPHADLRRGELAELLAEPVPDTIILADQPLGGGATAAKVLERVERGGILIRFAGPVLAQSAGAPDSLLPVRLLDGGRALGGVLSWTTPMRLAPFPESSPFHGLAIPAEVEVKAQVLAEPGLDLASHTWASLTDGTPLVTAGRRGKGWVVLIHTSANAEWSNLALSGLFVDMMRRLVALSQGGGGTAPSAASLAPARTLDGLGRLGPASGLASPLTPGNEPPRPGPRHPPGFYGPAEGGLAFNLGPALEPLRRLIPPPGAKLTALGEERPPPDLVPALLVAALVLALADTAATLALRGMLWRLGALVLLLAGGGGQAQAASLAMEAALTTRLACVATHDAAMDRTCLAGLRGLSAKLAERSTADLGEPMLVDPERDPVLFFPLLYWRITPGQPPLSANGAEKLNAYMARGGLIVFDTADEGQPGAGPDTAELTRLRELVRGLALPQLAPLDAEHVLNRSFYLLKEVPGRWDGATLWVSQDSGATNDGVSPVVLGGNDWVGAWAVDDRGRPVNAVIPGGERQREMAYRFGINLVMYALTGNYKADQVHLPAIMDRLRR